jgi:hypothetical protein
MKSFLGGSRGSSRWRLAVPAGVAVALLAVGIAAYFLSRGTGAGEGSAAAPAPSATPAPSPTPVATQPVSPTPSPASATPSPVSTTPSTVQRPTPQAPMPLDAPERPSCPEGWSAYDIPPDNYAFCVPQDWDVFIGSPLGGIIDIWNPAFSARFADRWPLGEDLLPGEITVQLNNMPKNPTIEEWKESCRDFELTISGEEAFGCVRYGSRVMGTPEDLITVTAWIDRDETILIASGGFWASKTADTDKETILQMARSIQLR